MKGKKRYALASHSSQTLYKIASVLGVGKLLYTILTYFSSIALATQTLQHLMSSLCPLNDYFFEFMKLSTKLNFSQSVFFSTAFPFHISSGFPYCLNTSHIHVLSSLCIFPSFSLSHTRSH